MFYSNRDMGCIIKGVYLVKGEKMTALEKGRTHTALSFRIKGNSVIDYGDKRAVLRDGTVAYFPAGLDYKRETLEDEEYIAIHLTAFGNIGDCVETVDDCDFLRPLFETLLDKWEKGNYDRSVSILYKIFEELSKKEGAGAEEIPEIILPGVEYMRNNYRDPSVTVASISEKCHISEAYFRRLYGKCFGISPVEALLSLRFDYARGLLRSGYYKTKEIAAMSGFSDVKYFRTAFKKRFGTTVGEFLSE